MSASPLRGSINLRRIGSTGDDRCDPMTSIVGTELKEEAFPSYESRLGGSMIIGHPKSKRARQASAWAGAVLIVGGLIFLVIHLADSARRSAAKAPPTLEASRPVE
jgi:hypothetical protein